MSQFSQVRRGQSSAPLFLLLSVLVLHFGYLHAQAQTDLASKLAWSTDSTGPARFISVHGRRAAVFGYPDQGLEVWAYPFQILSSLKATFRPQGTTTGIDGQSILRRVIYSPEAVTRIYAGPDFVVRERIFVPLDDPGAIVSYEVASARPVDVVVRFTPVLDLMWPGGIGGEDATWNSAASAYVLSEQRHRFSGSIGSPDIIAHDDTPNQSRALGREVGLAFTIRAGGERAKARVVIAGGPERSATTIAQKLLENDDSLQKLAIDHYAELLNNALQIETPDEATNRALAWSEIALDQAWVCNPDLGCGLAAGYGPSRRPRRPQYDWFFAGDGMVDLPALLAAGQYERARQELEFILKYQDQRTGMIWHELSQSAGWLDWSKYPNMFVHVELTFDFLDAMRNYFSATGDRSFVEAHWSAIQSAHEYCRSLVDPKVRLPRIPASKEGSREQESLSEELALSASWITASQAYASLAATTGHTADAAEASAVSRQTRDVIARRYWDEKQNFWITGYTRSGEPLIDRQIGPVSILAQGIFSERQSDSIVQQLASSDFETDWGTRGRDSSSSTYDPNSYANGSVWGVSSASVATAFWSAHRPATAFPIWSALIAWSSLDSLGHMHEALAGDYYHEELESVPEQTWSSATFFTAAVNGLFGLQVDGVSRRITFAPHLPPTWDAIAVRNLRVGSSQLDFKLLTSADEMRLQMQNDGEPIRIIFDPEIPLGAKLRSAHLQDKPISVTLEQHPQDSHAKVELELPHGNESLTIDYVGGVAVVPESPPVRVGEPSQTLKITKVSLQRQLYTVDFDYLPSSAAAFNLRTPWLVKNARGAAFKATSPGWYRFTVDVRSPTNPNHTYQPGEVTIVLARN
jgi:glycogen debranching enzyme